MDFEQRLQAELDSNPTFRRSATGKRAASVLAMPARRKARVLARMESHAKTQIGKEGQDVNWGRVSALNWESVLEFLKAILPLLLMFL